MRLLTHTQADFCFSHKQYDSSSSFQEFQWHINKIELNNVVQTYYKPYFKKHACDCSQLVLPNIFIIKDFLLALSVLSNTVKYTT